MLFISEQKYLISSPKKLRPIARLAKKYSPSQAIEILPFTARRASEPLLKVIKSAIANARQKGVSEDTLVFNEIRIGEGPALKRGRAVSRGRWHPYEKMMSHIRVVLETKEMPKDDKKQEVQKEVKEDKKEEKTAKEEK